MELKVGTIVSLDISHYNCIELKVGTSRYSTLAIKKIIAYWQLGLITAINYSVSVISYFVCILL